MSVTIASDAECSAPSPSATLSTDATTSILELRTSYQEVNASRAKNVTLRTSRPSLWRIRRNFSCGLGAVVSQGPLPRAGLAESQHIASSALLRVRGPHRILRAAPLVTQYFEVMGSRRDLSRRVDGVGIRATGAWVPGLPPGIRTWTPDQDRWELYNLDEDWTQNNDLAATMPEKLSQLKELRDRGGAQQGAANRRRLVGSVSPSRDANCAAVRPVELLGDITRLLEFCAPALGNKPKSLTITVDVPANANGVLYKLGSCAAGLTCFVEGGILCYQYNLFIIQRTKIRAKEKLPARKVTIDVQTASLGIETCRSARLAIRVNGQLFAEGRVPISAPFALHSKRLSRHRRWAWARTNRRPADTVGYTKSSWSSNTLALARGFERHGEIPGRASSWLAPRHVEPDDVDKRHKESQSYTVAIDGRLRFLSAVVAPCEANVCEPDELQPAVQIQALHSECPDRLHDVGVFESAKELVSTAPRPEAPAAYAVGAPQRELEVSGSPTPTSPV